MKTVLCFGDSNTWGYNPATQARYGHEERWTRRLQALLGKDYWVIEEGQNGRTTVHDDPVEGNKNGLTYLLPCLESHKPLDLVVLMLGTNDLKLRMSKTSQDIAKSVGRLVKHIRASDSGPGNKAPQVLMIAPPPLGRLTDFADSFSGSSEKSRTLGLQYRKIADELGCAFLDSGRVICSSDIDGIHFDADQLPLLAAAVKESIVSIC